MQNRKEIINKAINEFTQGNCSVLVKSDKQLLMDILNENLKKNNFSNIKIIIQLIGVIETDQQKKCFKCFSKKVLLKIISESSKDNFSVFNAKLDDFYKTDKFKNITNLLDRKIDSLISQTQDDILLKLLNSNLLYDNQLYYYYDKLVKYFLVKKEYQIVLEFIDSLGEPYDALYEIRPSFFYSCFKHAFSANNSDFSNSIHNVFFNWFHALDRFDIVPVDSGNLSDIINLYAEKCDDDILVKLIVENFSIDYTHGFYTSPTQSETMLVLLKRLAQKRTEILISTFENLLSNVTKEYESDNQIKNESDIRWYKYYAFTSLSYNLPLIIQSIPEDRIDSLLPLFDFMNKLPLQLFDVIKIKYLEMKDFQKHKKNRIDYYKKNFKIFKEKISILDNMLNELNELRDSSKFNKKNIIITILRKLVDIQSIEKDPLCFEIFPMPYFHNSLESKNSKVSDPLFDVLLSLFHFRFKNSIHEDDQQPLRNLVNTLYDNNKIEYLTKILRRTIVTVKVPNSNRNEKDNILFFILNQIAKIMFENNDDSSIFIQLDNYVNILFNALNERGKDECYKENELNELFAFEIISLNLKSVIERISIENLNKLSPLIELIRNSMKKLLTNKKLELKFKIEELDNQEESKVKKNKSINELNANRFLDIAFSITMEVFINPTGSIKGKEVFGEKEWESLLKNIKEFYREYHKKPLTSKVEVKSFHNLINFFSMYLASSFHANDELIIKKANILSNIIHVLNAKLITYKEARIKIQTQKDMMSFLTHTLNGALGTGQFTLKSVISDLAQENNLKTDEINRLTSLFSSFSLVTTMLDTFKIYLQDKNKFRENWKKDDGKDADIKLVLAEVLRLLFLEWFFVKDPSDRHKLLSGCGDFKNKDSMKDYSRKIKKDFIQEIIAIEIDKSNAFKMIEWFHKKLMFLDIQIKGKPVNFNKSNIRFGLFFSIFNEIINNSLKYSDGERPIQIIWDEDDNFFIFKCINTIGKRQKDKSFKSNKGLSFIKHLMSFFEGKDLLQYRNDGNNFEIEVKFPKVMF
jgi:hypothetical protein